MSWGIEMGSIGIKISIAVKKFASEHRQLFIALSVLFVGLMVLVLLVVTRRPPKRVEVRPVAALVKIRRAKVSDIEMVVKGYGSVSPKMEVEIAPQVSGNIVYVHPEFKSGGFVRAGEKLFVIDRQDYELAVQRAQAGVATAMVGFDMEKAEGQVARMEWEQLNPGKEPVSALVFREPQIRQAEAQLASAKAVLAQAQLNLDRTSLVLPVDVLVTSESVDLGQYVGAGKSIGSAYGIDSVEIEVPLEDKDLAWFEIPDNISSGAVSGNGAVAKVEADFAGGRHEWTGTVVRTTGQVDKASRLVSVVVEVDKPFDSSNGKVALMPGMFVEVLIEGKVLKNAVAVPRYAVRGRNEVWIVREGRLNIETLDVVRMDKEFAYVSGGLEDGMMIVVSSIDTVVDGMAVRTELADTDD